MQKILCRIEPRAYFSFSYLFKQFLNNGREPWSSGYGRRLMIQSSWVQIPAPYTGWTWHFFTLICCKNCNNVCLKKTENKRKRGRGWPIFRKQFLNNKNCCPKQDSNLDHRSRRWEHWPQHGGLIEGTKARAWNYFCLT